MTVGFPDQKIEKAADQIKRRDTGGQRSLLLSNGTPEIEKCRPSLKEHDKHIHPAFYKPVGVIPAVQAVQRRILDPVSFIGQRPDPNRFIKRIAPAGDYLVGKKQHRLLRMCSPVCGQFPNLLPCHCRSLFFIKIHLTEGIKVVSVVPASPSSASLFFRHQPHGGIQAGGRSRAEVNAAQLPVGQIRQLQPCLRTEQNQDSKQQKGLSFFLKKKEQQDEGDGNTKNQIVEFHDIRQGEQKDTGCRKGRPALPDRAEQEMYATLRQHQPRQTAVGKAGKKQQR